MLCLFFFATDLKVDVCEYERAGVLLVAEGAQGRVQHGGERLHVVIAEGLVEKMIRVMPFPKGNL